MHHKYDKLRFFSNIWRSIFSGNKELAHYLSAMAQALLSNLNYCGRSNFLLLLWKHWTVKDQNWFLFRVNFARGENVFSKGIEYQYNKFSWREYIIDNYYIETKNSHFNSGLQPCFFKFGNSNERLAGIFQLSWTTQTNRKLLCIRIIS